MSLPAGAVMLLHTSEEGQVRQEQMQPMTRMLMKRGRCPHVPSEGDRTVASSVVDKNIFAHVLKKRSDNS